MAHSVFKNICK